MNKANILRWWNASMGILLVLVFLTAGEGGDEGRGGDLHQGLGYLLMALVAGHLALNWTWIRSALTARKA
jgi:hypothetical protein